MTNCDKVIIKITRYIDPIKVNMSQENCTVKIYVKECFNSDGTIGTQNNIPKVIHLSINESNPSLLKQAVADKINQSDFYRVNDSDNVFYIITNRFFKTTDEQQISTLKYVFVLKKGKGDYGNSSGNTILASDVQLLTVSAATIDDIINDGQTQFIELGNVGVADILSSFNAHTFTGDETPIQDPNLDGYVIVNITTRGTDLQYLFTGEGGTYGTDGNKLAVITDFILLTDIENDPNTQFVYLGEIGSNLVENALNQFSPCVTIQDPIQGNVIVNTLIDGVVQQYLFSGNGGSYGNSCGGIAIASNFSPFASQQFIDLKGEKGDKGDVGEKGEKGDKGEKGERGFQGFQGIQGEKGDDGDDGADGADGIIGVDGEIGPQGIQGEIGLQGEQGLQGEPGLQGIQGIAGPIGLQGLQGDQGLQGIEGQQGVKGDKGDTGNDGAVGPTGATGSNGAIGATGADGTSITILGSYATELALNNAHPTGTLGDGWLVDGFLYVWNGTAWENVGSIQGPKGDIGNTGPQGPIGLKGDTGASGSNGAQGIQGIPGIQGPIGLKGNTGTTGAKGDKGDPFVYTDFTATQINNLKGPKGDIGNTGIKGDKGDIGNQGPIGNNGPIGVTGPKGDPFVYSDFTLTQLTALKGDKGDKGDTGATGAPGAASSYSSGSLAELNAGTQTAQRVWSPSILVTWINSRITAVQTWVTQNFAAIAHTHAFSTITSKPTTLQGYGITDAINTSNTEQTKAGKLKAQAFKTGNWEIIDTNGVLQFKYNGDTKFEMNSNGVLEGTDFKQGI